jgi:hypothetical protein
MLISINDLNLDDSIGKEFYEMMTFEKKVNNNFKKNIGIAMNLIKNKNSDFSVVEKIIDYLKIFNNSLHKISDEEINFIFDDISDFSSIKKVLNEDESNCDDEIFSTKINSKKVKTKNNSQISIDLLFKIDPFNIVNFTDFNLILYNELTYNKGFSQTSSISINEKIKNFKHNNFDALLSNFLQFDKKNISMSLQIDPVLINKSYLALGEEETQKIIINFNRTKDLSYLKYEIDHKNLIKEFCEKLNQASTYDPHIIPKVHNINYFVRNKVILKEKLFNRLQNEFPKISKEKLINLNSIIDYLYSFRNKKKIILENFNKEISDTVNQTELIVEEGIKNEINQIKMKVKEEEFNEMKQEMNNLHLKNKEIFDIKKKIKEEKLARENEILKQEKLKKEKEMKVYYGQIKKESEVFKFDKKQKEENIKLQQQKEIQILKNKLKEEVQIKLPFIEKRQKIAETKFVTQLKQKEIIREENAKKQLELNNIIENLKVRPKVEIDPERVKQITESLKIRYETKRDDADKIILFDNPGFTIDKLMSDMRYKISTALSEAGLMQCAYSNEILNAMSLAEKK